MRVQPPIITSSDCEGAGEVFTVSSNSSGPRANNTDEAAQTRNGDFFRHTKFLTVSSQLHLEAFVHEHQKVWALSPTFRAERSDTPRHVGEFWMLEAEFRTENLKDVMDLAEDMIRSLTVNLQDAGFIQEMEFVDRENKAGIESTRFTGLLHRRWEGLIQPSWPRITFQDAMRRLQDAFKSKETRFEREPTWDTGLQLEHERFIATDFGQGRPVFVTDYPENIKPFYMLPSSLESADDNSKRKTVACFDLLLPELCEIVGGSLREHRLKHLSSSMREHGINVSPAVALDKLAVDANASPSSEKGNLNWYADLRRYGSIPHGGFGLGFDRLLCYLTGISNIKDVIPWPRYYGRCDC